MKDHIPLYIKCSGCGELIEVPAELVGNSYDPKTGLVLMDEFYMCSSCEDISASSEEE